MSTKTSGRDTCVLKRKPANVSKKAKRVLLTSIPEAKNNSKFGHLFLFGNDLG